MPVSQPSHKLFVTNLWMNQDSLVNPSYYIYSPSEPHVTGLSGWGTG